MYEKSQISFSDTDSNVIYFENWLINQFGNEYSGNLLTTKTQNGTKMYLKFAFQVYAYKDKSYLIRNTMTIISFVTSVLGLAAGANAVGVIDLIAGADGLLHGYDACSAESAPYDGYYYLQLLAV
ncbi:MAG: hypothetical protein Q4B90_10490 [Eubacteriales bacterium]|nr:hypothetical protein [Eubacteriales bacterium]